MGSKNLELMQQKAKAAAEKWLSEQDIESRVRVMLDDRLVEIVAKLLGFNNDWGKWEVDHCNGRQGESAAGDWIRQRAGVAVTAWLDENAGSLPVLPQTAVRSLHKTYSDVLFDGVKRALIELAQREALQVAEKIVAEACQ